MTDIQYRKFQKDDAEEVSALLRRVFLEYNAGGLAELRDFSREKLSEIEIRTPNILVLVATAFMILIGSGPVEQNIFTVLSLFALVLFFLCLLWFVWKIRLVYQSAWESARSKERLMRSVMQNIDLAKNLSNYLPNAKNKTQEQEIKKQIVELNKKINHAIKVDIPKAQKGGSPKVALYRKGVNQLYIALFALIVIGVVLFARGLVGNQVVDLIKGL